MTCWTERGWIMQYIAEMSEPFGGTVLVCDDMDDAGVWQAARDAGAQYIVIVDDARAAGGRVLALFRADHGEGA